MSKGKNFEEYFYKSCLAQKIYCIRFPDKIVPIFKSGKITSVTSVKGEFDYFGSYNNRMFTIECKSTVKSSVNNIREHQIEALEEAHKNGIIAGFLLEYRQIEKIIYLPITQYNDYIDKYEVKALNYNKLINNGYGIEVDSYKPSNRHKPKLDLIKLFNMV